MLPLIPVPLTPPPAAPTAAQKGSGKPGGKSGGKGKKNVAVRPWGAEKVEAKEKEKAEKAEADRQEQERMRRETEEENDRRAAAERVREAEQIARDAEIAERTKYKAAEDERKMWTWMYKAPGTYRPEKAAEDAALFAFVDDEDQSKWKPLMDKYLLEYIAWKNNGRPENDDDFTSDRRRTYEDDLKVLGLGIYADDDATTLYYYLLPFGGIRSTLISRKTKARGSSSSPAPSPVSPPPVAPSGPPSPPPPLQRGAMPLENRPDKPESEFSTDHIQSFVALGLQTEEEAGNYATFSTRIMRAIAEEMWGAAQAQQNKDKWLPPGLEIKAQSEDGITTVHRFPVHVIDGPNIFQIVNKVGVDGGNSATRLGLQSSTKTETDCFTEVFKPHEPLPPMRRSVQRKSTENWTNARDTRFKKNDDDKKEDYEVVADPGEPAIFVEGDGATSLATATSAPIASALDAVVAPPDARREIAPTGPAFRDSTLECLMPKDKENKLLTKCAAEWGYKSTAQARGIVVVGMNHNLISKMFRREGVGQRGQEDIEDYLDYLEPLMAIGSRAIFVAIDAWNWKTKATATLDSMPNSLGLLQRLDGDKKKVQYLHARTHPKAGQPFTTISHLWGEFDDLTMNVVMRELVKQGCHWSYTTGDVGYLKHDSVVDAWLKLATDRRMEGGWLPESKSSGKAAEPRVANNGSRLKTRLFQVTSRKANRPDFVHEFKARYNVPTVEVDQKKWLIEDSTMWKTYYDGCVA